MSKISSLNFIALDIYGKNYLSWILDAEINLDAANLGETIEEDCKILDQLANITPLYLK